jgi:hypothetical protein
MNDITNVFASYFSSVYDTNNFIDTDLIDMPDTHSRHFFLNNCIISENEIIDFLGSLSDNASTGPDGIPPLFLKMCRYIIAKPYVIYLIYLSRMGFFLNTGKNHLYLLFSNQVTKIMSEIIDQFQNYQLYTSA